VWRQKHNTIIALWLIFTIGAYFWHALGGAERTLSIPMSSQWISAVDDRTQGGHSSSSIDFFPDYTLLTCNIRKQGTWSFCELKIDLEHWQNRGLNLKRYRTISLDIDLLKSPTPNERLRVFLRNYDEAYSSKDDPISLKFNAIEYSPKRDQGSKRIPLSMFQVSSWWIADYQVPLEQSFVQLDNIKWIEIATGDYVNDGEYQFRLNDLDFHGEWISKAELFQVLLGSWVVLAGLWLVIDARRLRHHLRCSVAEKSQWESRAQQFHQNALLNAEQAQKDPLTGAVNRYGLRLWLDKYLPLGDSITLLYLDLDHFKRINDDYGHNVGDLVLTCFSHVIAQTHAHNGKFVRWGGEEFLLFCPNITDNEGLILAKKIQASLALVNWPHDLPVTVSIGVAQWHGEAFSEWIHRADLALYQAKENGRNCSVKG
jgi:diguanylate cyclase (GGDEF)-like protein